MTQAPPIPPADANGETRAPSPRRKWFRVLCITGGVILLLVAAAPTLLNWFGATSLVRKNLSKSLDAEVELERVSIGWLGGLDVYELTIHNPPGFADQPAIRLAKLSGDIGFLDLFRGRVDLEGRVIGLEIHAIQKEDGTLNLEKLAKPKPAVNDAPRPTDPRPGEHETGDGGGGDKLAKWLGRLRLDLALEDATVVVEHETQGTIETIRNLRVDVKKPYDATDVVLDLHADLGTAEQPGRLALSADVDSTLARPIDVDLSCESIDLARYRPLLAAKMPDQVDEFAGVVEGQLGAHVDLTARPKTDIVLDGELRVREPRLAGALFAGMTIHAPQWTIRPGLTAKLDGSAQPVIDTSKLSVDLGFASLTGIDEAKTAKLCGGPGLGAAFALDLARLTEFGGKVPPELEAENVRLDGSVALRADGGALPTALPELLAAVGLDAEFAAGHLALQGRALENLVTDLEFSKGRLSIRSRDGARVDGGALSFDLSGNLADLTSDPVALSVRVGGANVGGSAVEGLRFVVPFLAGIAPDAASVDFQSALDLTLNLSGPPMPAEGEDTLAWLEKWSGSGDLGLANGSVTPAPAIAELLKILGQREKLRWDSVTSVFDLDAGALKTDALRFLSNSRDLALRGRTTLRGDIDYSIDVASLLRGHRDGERVLQVLGTAGLDAGIGGTITDPKLKLPKLEELIQKAAGNAVKDVLDQQIDKLDEKLQDKVPKELRGVLDGIFGGGRKKNEKKDG